MLTRTLQGKALATVYARAVSAMLPKTRLVFHPDGSLAGRPHEPINDIAVHPATRRQLFVSVPESRHFTRAHAARAFDPTGVLLPADARIPHPQLVVAEQARVANLPKLERERAVADAARTADDDARRRIARRNAAATGLPPGQLAAGGSAVLVASARRWDFRFQPVAVDALVGDNGRGPHGIGWRYGFPHEDRKKGQVKIPVSVD